MSEKNTWTEESTDNSIELDVSTTKVPHITPLSTLNFGIGYRTVFNFRQQGLQIETNVALMHTMHPTTIHKFMDLDSSKRLEMNSLLSELRIDSKTYSYKVWSTFNWMKVKGPHLVISYMGMNTRLESTQELRNTALRLKIIYHKFLDKLIELEC